LKFGALFWGFLGDVYLGRFPVLTISFNEAFRRGWAAPGSASLPLFAACIPLSIDNPQAKEPSPSHPYRK